MDNKLVWQGPFVFHDEENCIFNQESAKIPGVYLWTIDFGGGYLINYVGIATNAVSARLQEHLVYFLGGNYTIYQLDEFILGKKKSIYSPDGHVNKFLNDYDKLSTKVDSQLRAYRLFYANVSGDREWLERIESGIISTLREAKSEASSFLDNFRLSRIVPAEDKKTVNMVNTASLISLPETIYA